MPYQKWTSLVNGIHFRSNPTTGRNILNLTVSMNICIHLNCSPYQSKKTVLMMNVSYRDYISPFETDNQVQHTERKMKNTHFKYLTTGPISNDQTPFVSPFPSTDSLKDKLHLVYHRSLSGHGMFLLICMGYMYVILFVGKSWHGQIHWVYYVERKLETPQGRWNRAGKRVEKEMWPPVGILGPLLRFIGVGNLRTWGIIHGKASMSGPVYKMRQAWQRWRPSTTEPSCLNMGPSHLT